MEIMAISRSQMRRQLSNRGGITNLSPRQNFGLGSKLKRTIRKIIPNEVSKIAVKAAPFVAPFNPALAGAMAGIGSFDQTGSISDALKSGALTYGGGQAARYIGGAGFQGNPFAQGGAFTSSGFTSGFSSPFGTETGLGKFFSKPNAPIQEVKPLGYEGSEVALTSGSPVDLGADTFTEEMVFKDAITPTNLNDYQGTKQAVESVKENVFQRIVKDPSIENIGKEALNAAKKAGKAIFYDKDGNLDKNVLLGTIAFTASYAEAKSLANDVGVDLTESEYDEARKAEKKEEYASNLQNFFAGKKEGGRIGFENGTTQTVGLDMEALRENVRKYPEKVNEITNFEVGIFEPSETTDQGPFPMDDETQEEKEAEMLKELLRELEADGGRIGYDGGGRSGVIGKIADLFFDEEGNYSKALQRAKFEFSKFVSGMGTDLDTGAEWYNKLEPNEQKAIIEEKIKYRQRTDDVPLYDERYAGTRGIGGNYADGGRIGLGMGGSIAKAMEMGLSKDQALSSYKSFLKLKDGGYKMSFFDYLSGEMFAIGGRVGLREGTGSKKKYGTGIMSGVKEIDPLRQGLGELKAGGGGLPLAFTRLEKSFLFKNLAKLGGADRSFTMPQLYRILSNPSKFPKDAEALKAFLKIKGFQKGGDVGSVNEIPVRRNKAGVQELDMRASGGFVPIGVKEKADDVPAMLSKNEFVLTADAVRGIGGGSVEKGSEKLYNLMKSAEQVGKA